MSCCQVGLIHLGGLKLNHWLKKNARHEIYSIKTCTDLYSTSPKKLYRNLVIGGSQSFETCAGQFASGSQTPLCLSGTWENLFPWARPVNKGITVTHLFLSGKVSFFLFGGGCLRGWKLKNKFEPVNAKEPKLDFEKLSENFVNAYLHLLNLLLLPL